MKKIFIVIWFIAGLFLNSTTYASMVRVADTGAENLVGAIQGIVASNPGLQSFLRVTNIKRDAQLDITKEQLYCWICKYGQKNASTPDGVIVLWVDEKGYVQRLKLVHDVPNLKNSSLFLVRNIVLQAIGMSSDEIQYSGQHYKKQQTNHYVSVVWSKAKNRQYVMSIFPRIRVNDPSVSDWGFMLLANDNVNEIVDVSIESFTYEPSIDSWT